MRRVLESLSRASLIAAAIFAFTGCGDSEAIVDLTIAIDPSVSGGLISQARSLELNVGGFETADVTDQLDHPFAAGGTERLVIRSATSGAVTIAATVRSVNGIAILTGNTNATLTAGATTAATLTLFAAPPPGADGGVFDLATTDQAPPGPDMAQPVCPNNVLLCDGFESGNISTAIWDNDTPPMAGAITVEKTHAHRGQYSLHVHTNAITSGNTTYSMVSETHTFGATAATFYVRAWYYFPSSAITAVVTLLDGSQTVTPFNDVSLAVDHDALSMYNAFNGGSYTVSTTPLLPTDQWACIEWEVNTGTPNQLHAWINDQPVTMLDLMQPTTGTPPIGDLDIGLGIYPPNSSTAAIDAWIDDVIVDSAPIGCAK